MEILTRDNYVCAKCLKDNFECQLDVHHITYIKGRRAWDYQDWFLVTLCRDCHEQEHKANATNDLNQIMYWVNRLLGSNIQNETEEPEQNLPF